MNYGIITWNAEKNNLLFETRGVCFEDVELAIYHKEICADIPHPLSDKYPNQRILIVVIRGYAFNVPYVQTDEGVFLKTIYPSRKSKKIFFKEDVYE